MDKLADDYDGKIKITKVNVDENQDTAVKFDVRGIPCIVIFSNGKEIDRIVGAYPEAELRKKIDLTLAKA